MCISTFKQRTHWKSKIQSPSCNQARGTPAKNWYCRESHWGNPQVSSCPTGEGVWSQGGKDFFKPSSSSTASQRSLPKQLWNCCEALHNLFSSQSVLLLVDNAPKGCGVATEQLLTVWTGLGHVGYICQGTSVKVERREYFIQKFVSLFLTL